MQPSNSGIGIDWQNEPARAWLAAIVDSSYDAIVSKDLDGVITSWNRAAESLFGYTSSEAIGQSVRMLIPADRQDEEEQILSRVRRGEKVDSFETVRKRKNGSIVQVSLTISPIHDEDGRIIGASKIARDITATRENERRIRLLLREINHRVKNQYAVILAMVRETLKHSESSEQFQQQIQYRIAALAKSHDLLVEQEWKEAMLLNLIQQQLAPFGNDHLVATFGPPVRLNANAVLHLGMAFHELATNSMKYGVLGKSVGSIGISWSLDDADGFHLVWEETVAQSAPASSRGGFGTLVLTRISPQALNGSAAIELMPEQFRWNFCAALADISEMADP